MANAFWATKDTKKRGSRTFRARPSADCRPENEREERRRLTSPVTGAHGVAVLGFSQKVDLIFEIVRRLSKQKAILSFVLKYGESASSKKMPSRNPMMHALPAAASHPPSSLLSSHLW